MLSYHICTCNVKIKKCSCKDTTRLGAQFQIHMLYEILYVRASITRGWIHTLPWPLLLPKEYQDTWGGYRGTNIWS